MKLIFGSFLVLLHISSALGNVDFNGVCPGGIDMSFRPFDSQPFSCVSIANSKDPLRFNHLVFDATDCLNLEDYELNWHLSSPSVEGKGIVSYISIPNNFVENIGNRWALVANNFKTGDVVFKFGSFRCHLSHEHSVGMKHVYIFGKMTKKDELKILNLDIVHYNLNENWGKGEYALLGLNERGQVLSKTNFDVSFQLNPSYMPGVNKGPIELDESFFSVSVYKLKGLATVRIMHADKILHETLVPYYLSLIEAVHLLPDSGFITNPELSRESLIELVNQYELESTGKREEAALIKIQNLEVEVRKLLLPNFKTKGQEVSFGVFFNIIQNEKARMGKIVKSIVK